MMNLTAPNPPDVDYQFVSDNLMVQYYLYKAEDWRSAIVMRGQELECVTANNPKL